MNKMTRALTAAAMVFLLAGLCSAQINYFPYYGKNKVNYDPFEWKHYRTDHFDIYYYEEDIAVLQRIANFAESAYKRISQELKHQVSAVIPVLYFSNYTEFEQNNLTSVGESVLGLAEPILYRFLVRGDMANDELQDLVEHELTHIFQYDILYGGPGMALYALGQPPSWIIEGFADYNTDSWSDWSSLIVRDAVVNDRIPDLSERGALVSRYPLPRPAGYDFGHAMFEFIEERYGKNAVREFWHSMKNSSLLRSENPIKKAFDMEPKQFGHEFKKYMRQKHKTFLMRENPEDYSLVIGPEFPFNQYYFSFSHAVSPSGELVATLTVNYGEQDFDVVLISTKTGKVIKNITRGYSLKYENIRFEVDPTRGKHIAWSPDGDTIAFFARAGRKYKLFLVNALTGKTDRSVSIDIDSPGAPHFLPNGKEMLFTGFETGFHDIFKLNLETEKVINLTNDELFEKGPTVSNDGEYVAYSIKMDVNDKLFISPINDFKKKTQLTFGRGNTITPAFSMDDKEVYFVGNQRDAYNIYSVNRETGELKRYTDVRTGNFYPTPVANNPKKLVFSSFNKGAYQIFCSELEGETEKTITFAEMEQGEQFERFDPIVHVDINKNEIKAYKGMGKLHLMARPPIDTIVSTDGSLWGGSSLTFSDIMGNHIFNLTAYQVRNFRSYYFSYINQTNRLQFMAQAYSYSIYYYAPYYYTDPYLYNLATYRDAMAVRSISGATVAAYYPFNRYYRAEGILSFTRYDEDFFDPSFNTSAIRNAGNAFTYFISGNVLNASVGLTGETTRFNYYGPMKGNTFRFSIAQAVPVVNSFITNTTADIDFRQYLYLGADALFAFRFNGFLSRGKQPFIFYWGGNNQVRSSYYYNIIGNEGWYANLEFRFPILSSLSTAIGNFGPVRGAFFFDVSRAKIKGLPAKLYRYDFTESSLFPEVMASDATGSYGFGFQFFFLGIPIHLEFVKELEFQDISMPWDFNAIGKFKTKFWIGFDF